MRRFAIASGLALFGPVLNSQGQVCNYTGPSSGSWFEPTNWSCGNQPDLQVGVVVSGLDVVLDRGTTGFAGDLSMFAGGSVTLETKNGDTARLHVADVESIVGWRLIFRLIGDEPGRYDDPHVFILTDNQPGNLDIIASIIELDLPTGWTATFSRVNQYLLYRIWIVADCNRDQFVTPADFTAWVAAYNAGDLARADQNLDGMISPADFSAWVANYNEFIGGG